MKKKRINSSELYIIGIIFGLMFVLLTVVQSNVSYDIYKGTISLLPKRKISDNVYHDVGCLMITDSSDLSYTAQAGYQAVLDGMKVNYDICVAEDFTPEKLGDYKQCILLATDYNNISRYTEDIMAWVENGNSLMLGCVPEIRVDFKPLYKILGIKDAGKTVSISGVHFNKMFAIGCEKTDYPIMDAENFTSTLDVTINDDCTVYMSSMSDVQIPLIWKRQVGRGNVVVNNFHFFDKAYRGILCIAYSLLDDICIYPVINGAAFYIDDFPAPIPEGDGSYIKRDYNMTISDFFSQVWWTDIYNMAQRYNIKYTGLVIENYSDQVRGTFKRNIDTSKMKYFGNMLLRSEGEIGIHGYDHMPLVTNDFDYQGQYDGYKKWASKNDMKNSLDEVIDFTGSLFKDTHIYTYVPPSNILSEEGRELLTKTCIRTIASVYFHNDIIYEQEFDVADDGMINTPRITSGYIIDDYMQIAAMAELNFHLVNTHFIHPDDVLDEDRGAAQGWKEMYRKLCQYMEWLKKSCPKIRRLTGTEFAAAVQRYDRLDIKYDTKGNTTTLELGNFVDEAYVLLRINNGKHIDKIIGGSYERAAEDFYIIKCDSDKVDIIYQTL